MIVTQERSPAAARRIVLAIPLIATKLIGYRNGTEFVDVYPSIPRWMRSLLLVAMFYGIVFFGARVRNEFIYLQF